MNVLESFSSGPKVKRLAAHVWRHFSEDRLFDEAASLSYTSLLSMVPLLAVVFGVASAFPVFQQWSEQLQTFVFSNFVPASGDQIQSYLAGFLESVGKLTLTGTLVLILTALLLMLRIERTFNLIWRVPTARSIRDRVIMYWAVLTLGPLALGAAIGLSAQPIFEQVAVGASTSSGWRAVGVFSLSWLAFTLMFLLVPNRRVRITHALVGAFLSAVLFGLAKKAFVGFVANASFNVIYGALATIPIFLFWLYLVWIVILLGASLAASLTTFNERKVDWGWPNKWEFLLAYRLVGHLWKAQADGSLLSNEELLDLLEGSTETELAGQLGLLFDAGLVTRSEIGSWLLCRDLDTVSLLDLYHAGEYYLPVGEKLEIPSNSEWDTAFFNSVKLGKLNMQQSLKAMYIQVDHQKLEK
ncbi:MAG: YihY family inner membrane protein [Gammaproteobacteria bacterium]|nr:YihY family inner membrane protein [Gammaproteobacteria bacterium]